MQVESTLRAPAGRWHRLLAVLAALCWGVAPAGELLEVPYPDLASAEPAVETIEEGVYA